jgi:hypothetical protein
MVYSKLGSDADPDSHQRGKLDPHPDPHQSEKQDLDADLQN